MGHGTDAAAWCILRTNGGRTLPLAQSLAAAGIEAWTPTRAEKRRAARSKAVKQIDVPIMPTFVFVRAVHIVELRRCLSLPSNPHPPFSLFRHGGRIPLISDRSLESLRSEERREKPKALRATFPIHSRVRLPESILFGGMSGVVQESNGKVTLVCFGGRLSVKIDTFLLRDDGVYGEQADASHAPAAAA